MRERIGGRGEDILGFRRSHAKCGSIIIVFAGEVFVGAAENGIALAGGFRVFILAAPCCASGAGRVIWLDLNVGGSSSPAGIESRWR